MSAERIPQSKPPTPPERPPLVLTEYVPTPGDARRRLKDSDRLFALCFVPAVGIVALACVGLGLAGLNQRGDTTDRSKPMRLQWYRPPTAVASKPVTPRQHTPRLAIRPSHTAAPRLVSHQPAPPRVSTLPPVPTPHAALPHPTQVMHVPTPPPVAVSPPPHAGPPSVPPHPSAPRMSRPAAPVQTAPPAMSSGGTPSVSHTARPGHTGPSFSTATTAPINVPLAGGSSMQPTAPTQFAPEPAAPPKQSVSPRPVETPRAVEPSKPVEAPKPKPADPPKPAHYVGSVDSREASVDDGSIQTPDADGIDTSSLNGSCVISFEVDENGRLSGVRVKKSCGSSEMDQRCADAVRHGRGIPAVQDHIAYRAKGQYTFSL